MHLGRGSSPLAGQLAQKGSPVWEMWRLRWVTPIPRAVSACMQVRSSRLWLRVGAPLVFPAKWGHRAPRREQEEKSLCPTHCARVLCVLSQPRRSHLPPRFLHLSVPFPNKHLQKVCSGWTMWCFGVLTKAVQGAWKPLGNIMVMSIIILGVWAH